MFQRTSIQNLVVLLLLSLVLRANLLALLSALLLLTAALAWAWNHYSLARLTYERRFSETRLFPGDTTTFTVRISNRKPLPLALVHVTDIMPSGIQMDGEDVRVDRDDRMLLQRTTSLRWYERVVWTYTLTCERRGAFRIGPATLETGDAFGFYSNSTTIDHSETLVVYPNLLPLEELGLPARNPIGTLRSRQLIRDPLRTVGVRDYLPDDPIKDVHWSATARTGRLQTRIYEPTTSRDLAIVIDLDSFEQYWQGVNRNQVERVISAAATLAHVGQAEGYAIGLYVNGAPAQFEKLVRLPPSRSPAQLERVMDTLARLTTHSVAPVARVLRNAASELPWGATILLISTIQPQATRAELLRLRERGRAVSWLYMGADTAPSVPGLHVHHAPPDGDWRAAQAPAETRIG